MQIAKDESGLVLKLSGPLEINGADQLRAALLDFVCRAAKPVVDLSGVTGCDTTAFQLLVSAGRTAERSAKPFELVGLSAAVRAAGAALGLSITEASTGHEAHGPRSVPDTCAREARPEDAI